MYYTYMLRCEDNSIYTGITTNLERRIEEHKNRKTAKYSKYTLNHTVKQLETAWKSENRALASKLEYHIKKLSKSQKEEIIQNPEELGKLLKDQIEYDLYTIVKKDKNIE